MPLSAEIADNPRIRPPRLDVKVTERLTEDQVAALVRACAGKDFGARRDEAIVRVMFETAIRAGEVVGLTVPDVDMSRGLQWVGAEAAGLVARHAGQRLARLHAGSGHDRRGSARYTRSRRTR